MANEPKPHGLHANGQVDDGMISAFSGMGKLFSGGAKAVSGLFKGGSSLAKAGSSFGKIGQTVSHFTKPITSAASKIGTKLAPGLTKATQAFDHASTYVSPFI